MNKLFMLMLKELTPEDLLKLGKSQSCSQYVFLMADSMKRLFDDLRIHPKKDKDSGVILFQKVDTLKAKTAETKQLCLFVSYFFIRVFQIFGAVALTILDDPSAGQVLGAVRFGAPAAVGIAGRPAPGRLPGSRGAFLVGGAQAKYFGVGKAANLAPIRELLNEPTVVTNPRSGLPRNEFAFTNADTIVLIPDRLDSRGKPQNLRAELSSGGKLYGHLMLTLLPVAGGGRKVRAQIGNFSYSDSVDPSVDTAIATQLKTMNVNFDSTSLDGGSTWIASGGKSFEERLMEIVYQVEKRITDIKMDPTAAYKPIRGLMPRVPGGAGAGAAGYPGGAGYGYGGPYPGAAGAPAAAGPGLRFDIAVSKPFQNEYIINALKQLAGYKSTSFCVARALQLLDANTLYNPTSSTNPISGVCKLSPESLGASVPQARQPLGKVPGLKALDQLWYTQPALDAREEFSLKVKDLSAYATFLSDLSTQFGKPATTAMTELDKILVKDPACPATAVNKYLQLQDPKAVKEVLSIIGRMFGRQKEHTEAAIRFLTTRLFRVEKRREGTHVDLNPRILERGMDELEAVSKEARDLLVKYYKGCEDLYVEGAKKILAAKSIPV